MNRRGSSGFSPCCCNSNRNPSRRCATIEENVEEAVSDENEDCGYYRNTNTRTKNPSCINIRTNDPYAAMDGQTLNTLTSLRHKACRFLRSESDSSEHLSAVSNHPPRCSNSNHCRGSSLLRQANDLIDYNPQSEFLKKMKQQCQFLQNNQPNIFSNLDNSEEFFPQECQKCIEKAKRILTAGDRIRCSKSSSPAEAPIRGCMCGQQFRLNCSDDSRTQARDSRSWRYYSETNDFNDNQGVSRISNMCKCNAGQMTDDVNEKVFQKPSKREGEERSSEKKSEHISRSKKVIKCKGRRKRKSKTSEKCESEEEFEPNLKKPHENSCERCWRFASPSRSPVNKPEQKYDPNFRRAHSCLDFKGERGDGDLEVTGKHVSPCKNLQPITSREKVPEGVQFKAPRSPLEVLSQRTQHSQQKTQRVPQPHHQAPEIMNQYILQKDQCIPQQQQQQATKNGSFTKVKELMYNYSRSKSPEKVTPKSQPCESVKKSPTDKRILQSDTGRKPRPKSCTAGSPTLSPNAIPSYALDTTEYYDLCMKSKQGPDQTDGKNKKSEQIYGSNVQRCSGETNFYTPTKSNRVDTSSNNRSTPKQCFKPKSPEQSGKKDLVENTSRNSNPKSPKFPFSPILDSESTKTDSTVYAEITRKNWCTPKSSSSRKKSKNGKSPKRGKTSPKASVEGACPTSNIKENLSQHPTERSETDFVREKIPIYGPINEKYIGAHPIRDCWCPPRAPFVKGNFTESEIEDEPDHVFCCHCHWEDVLKDQMKNRRDERQNLPCNKMSDRQYTGEGTSAQRRSSPHGNGPPKKNLIRLTEELELKCPYRAFQLEKRAANDTSWEKDYQNLKDYCLRNPKQYNFQVSTKTKSPFKSAENVPTKYAVFYMTQNKRDKDGDVEVLVEELTQACPNDPRTKDITEKMRKITECPSDSMALRFEKGVSRSCRTPQSSRILYF